MSNFPPEKYYEACITYNLISEFDLIFEKKLFPFSISQLEEKSNGYDFGYTYSDQSFFIQYKRPITCDPVYSWKICREQLNVINSHEFAIKTYYALPDFIDTMQWYTGLEKTYFVSAPQLKNYLDTKKTNEKISSIKANSTILKRSDDIFFNNTSFQKNVAYKTEPKLITFKNILSYIESFSAETKNTTWAYLIKENTDEI